MHPSGEETMALVWKIVLGVGSLLVLGAAGESGPASVPMPPGISIRLTIEGPVFVEASGMTLYKAGSLCTNEHSARARPTFAEGDVDFTVMVERKRSCLEKNPPLIAPADAQPIGKWTINVGADGTRQWAYAGEPLHTSIKDKAPGDINGSYVLRLGRAMGNAATASLTGVPAGIQARETVAGLALVNHQGKTLYYSEAESECAADCTKTWQPLAAAAIADTHALSSDWSIVTRSDRLRQWAFKGKGLYTYAHDTPKHGEQVFGDVFGETWAKPIDGWRVATLVDAPRSPSGVTVQTLSGDSELFSFGLPKTVYATAEGRTLYTVHCIQGNEEGGYSAACDDIGDDPRYWLSYCGGEELCVKTWRPFRAPADAQPIDNIWSVVTINPKNPFQPVEGNQGIPVWAYRGRPLFTYAHDTLAGDFYGDDHGFGTTGAGQMQARPIPAHAFAPANQPVMSGDQL
jgi:predicted lipoprotein with Yx(FWY)xxD motif